MYETYFGLVNRPFLTVPTLERYYPGSTIEQTFQMAARAISRAEGPVAIFGGTGLGKTMLCLRIAEHFRRNYDVVMLSSSQLITRRALLQNLLFELKMPYRNLNEGELRLTLMNRLQPSPEHPGLGLLLIADEAQTLSPKLLDEIRLLTNITRDGMPRVRLVLCGTMKLEDSLSNPRMESLCQRLSCRCYLTPLTPQETAGYVAHKIELSGATVGSVITREAIDAIYRGTDGIPRLIDQLADQTLLLAAQERQRPISAALVGKAWGMLQQLPNPWSEPETIKGSEKSEASIAESPSSSEATTSAFVRALPSIESSLASQYSAGQFSSGQYSLGQYSANETRREPSSIGSFQLKDILPSLERNLEGQDDIVEYGSLDDIDSEYQLAPTSQVVSSIVPPSASIPSGSGKPASVSGISTNPTEVFGADFDEEFSLPVQSSPAYQTYSGVAFGNLRDESTNLTREQSASKYSIPEATEFLEPRLPQQVQQPVVQKPALDNAVESRSLSQSQASFIEKQIEEEMREIVSELNMNAMMFDPAQPIDSGYQSVESNYERAGFEPTEYTESERASYFSSPLSLADSTASWEEETRESALFRGNQRWDNEPIATDHRSAPRGDDRDILIIETESEPIRGTASPDASKSSRPVLHPYAKLFSNLR
ncbi:MAG: AAA family ATPase [Pirellula sp.]|jgi:type II secretory pathway predicted ATPase ExeA|nr:AAA family ATPase [Pirellula sp.]